MVRHGALAAPAEASPPLLREWSAALTHPERGSAARVPLRTFPIFFQGSLENLDSLRDRR